MGELVVAGVEPWRCFLPNPGTRRDPSAAHGAPRNAQRCRLREWCGLRCGLDALIAQKLSQAIPKLALAGATCEKTIQEVEGLLPGSAGLLRLATITPATKF